MSEISRVDAAEPRESELLLHFYLPQGGHQLDAFLLNKCEAEFLAVLREIGKQLDVSFEVEVQAYGEGGITVLLKLVKAHALALSIIGGAIVGICTAADWILYKAPLQRQQLEKNQFELDRDRRLAEQQYEQNELNLKKARIELKKLEQEASDGAPKMPATDASKPLELEGPPKPDDVIPALIAQRKIVRHRSRFYELLLESDKVSQVGFAQSHHPSEGQEVIVPRHHFAEYVVTLDELPPSSMTMVSVEIVSPVFRRGKYKWRGILSKKVIAFEIADEAFLTKVATRKVKFQSGTTLVCDIDVQAKENEAGDIEGHTYTVTRVHKHYNKDAPLRVKERLAVPVEERPEEDTRQLELRAVDE
jgi:hypothetical protein